MVVTALVALLQTLPVAALQASISSQTNVSCIGFRDGSLTVTASGGQEPYAYAWSPGAPFGDGTPTVSELAQGTYSVVVTDAAFASVVVEATITRRSNLRLDPISQLNVTCFGGANGFAAVGPPSGGFGITRLKWSPGSPVGDGTTQVSGLTAGTWTATASDELGCTASVNFFVLQPAPVALMPAAEAPVSCFGGADGSATATAPTGGTPPYALDWSPGAPAGDGTLSASGLTAGEWTLTATDSNGCQGSTSFSISEPAPLALTAVTTNDVSCHGAANGSISVVPGGGNGGYVFAWSPGDPMGDTSPHITGLGPGQWHLALSDSKGCTFDQDFVVAEPTLLEVAPLAQTNARCFGGADGSAAVAEPTGGVPPYTYEWGPADPAGDGGAAVTGLSAGNWQVLVTDSNGCTASESFAIGQGAEILLALATLTPASCLGAADGAVSVVDATGGAGGFSYDWAPGDPAGDGTTSVSGLQVGTYTVTATDAQACSRSVSADVTGPVVLSLAPNATPPACAGGQDGTASVQVAGGQPPYAFSWDGVSAAAETATQLAAGAYSVTVTDQNGCYARSVVEVLEPPALQANGSSRGISAVGACDAEAAVAPSGGTPPYAVEWTPSGASDVALSGLCAGRVGAAVTDANGCAAVFAAELGADTADLSVVLAGDAAPVGVGDEVELTVTLKATPPAAGARLYVAIADSLTLSATQLPEAWRCVDDAGLRCTAGAPLDEATLTLRLGVRATHTAREARVVAELSAQANDPDATNNRAEWTIPVLLATGGCGGCQNGDVSLTPLALVVAIAWVRSRRRALRIDPPRAEPRR